MIQAKKYMLRPSAPLSVSLRSIIMITSPDHSVSYLLFTLRSPVFCLFPVVVLVFVVFCLFVSVAVLVFVLFCRL